MAAYSDHRPHSVPPQASACEAGDTVEAILRAAQQIRRLLNDQLEACGLNDVRYAVLCMVHRCAERGGCSQAELAARLDQSESSVSMLIDRMRADRLLHRLRTTSDRRRRRLVLTDEGRSLLEHAGRVYGDFVQLLAQFCPSSLSLQAPLNEISATLTDGRVAGVFRDRVSAASTSFSAAASHDGSRGPTGPSPNPSEISPAA